MRGCGLLLPLLPCLALALILGGSGVRGGTVLGVVAGGERGGRREEQLVLLPSPSDSLPILPLLESPDPRHDPQPRDLQAAAILLGPLLDRNFSSTRAPGQPALAWEWGGGAGGWEWGGGGKRAGGRSPPGRRPGWLRLLRSARLEGGLRLRLRLSRRERRRVQRYVWRLTRCPVKRAWRDLGARFFPRYVRDGTCVPRSCSLPAGMTCQEDAGSRHQVPLLRWFCQDFALRRGCHWLPLHFPVLTRCKCACSGDHNS